MPRWSVARQPVLVPALMAGLPSNRAWVKVGPPLSASGPSCGGVLIWSPGPPPQVLSLERLLPEEVTPTQLPTVLPATIVFLIVIVPPQLRRPPPLAAALLAIVLLVKVTLAEL